MKMAEPACGVKAAYGVAAAAGARGMIGGQTLDLENEKITPDEARLERTDALKTGALFKAACTAGAYIAGADENGIAAAIKYAENLGLAFQIIDDILDVTADETELGKPIGSDAASGKRTYIDFYGVEECRARARELTNAAVEAVSPIAGSDFLIWLAHDLAERIR